MRPRQEPEAAAVADEKPPRLARWLGTRARLGLLALLVACGVVVGIVLATGDSSAPLDRAQVGTIASDVVGKAIDDLRGEPTTSAVVYQQILPSIVAIETRSPSSDSDDGAGLGTGVIVDARGTILTALHVVDEATRIRVSFVDGTKSAAAVVAADRENDIAVLAPELLPEVVVPAVLGGGAQIGEEAYAVGHQLGYVGSITSGVISGLERMVEGEDGTMLDGLIQFDAAVNPGSSGGPLLNRGGQVIGIVTALANPARDGYFTGVGFAVTIGTAGGAADAPSK